LQHIIANHALDILNVSENFSKIKHMLPESTKESVKIDDKKEKKIELVNDNIYSAHLPNYDDEINQIENNNLLNDRSFYRNYLFRRQMLKSDDSIKDDDSEIDDNNEVSVHSQVSPASKYTPSYKISSNDQNQNNLLKFPNFDKKKTEQKLDSLYSKFDVNTADEEDYQNLYNQLVNQNKQLKIDIIDKIKKNENDDLSGNRKHSQYNFSQPKNIEEEAKEIDNNCDFVKSSSMLNSRFKK